MIPDRIREALLEFRRARDWEQFHSPKNLAIALSVEAAELLELFQWTSEDGGHGVDGKRLSAIKEEMADLAILLTYLAHDLGVDLDRTVQDKLRLNGERYPVESSRGNATKHSEAVAVRSESDFHARFGAYIGIDYSGAETPEASLKGLRVYESWSGEAPVEVPPPPSPRKYWTRRGIVEWLLGRLREGPPVLVGIDHAFSFPRAYFDEYGLPKKWDAFLADFVEHWPTHEPHTYVDFVRDGAVGAGMLRSGRSNWRRLTDRRAGSAKSVFHFDVQGQVAKSTHAGLPWLYRIRHELRDRVHFWPFDGWTPPSGKSVMLEVYPRLWNKTYPREERTADQHDAYVVAAELARAANNGELEEWLAPPPSDIDRVTAEYEGWILGVR